MDHLEAIVELKKVEEIPKKLKQLENKDESNYARTMNIARQIFKNYNPRNKNLELIATLGRKLF